MTHDTTARMISRRGIETLDQLNLKYPKLDFIPDSFIEWSLVSVGNIKVNTQYVRGRVFIDRADGMLEWYTDIIGASYEEVMRTMKTLYIAADKKRLQNAEPTLA